MIQWQQSDPPNCDPPNSYRHRGSLCLAARLLHTELHPTEQQTSLMQCISLCSNGSYTSGKKNIYINLGTCVSPGYFLLLHTFPDLISPPRNGAPCPTIYACLSSSEKFLFTWEGPFFFFFPCYPPSINPEGNKTLERGKELTRVRRNTTKR